MNNLPDYPPTGETWKAHERRVRTGWYEKFAPSYKPGIDIAPFTDPLNRTFRRWYYKPDGDATFMDGVPNNTFVTVYASHILEHLQDYDTALINWFRVLKPEGHLIVLVPHRDRYEKRKALRSRWNPEHKHFFLPDVDEEPCTLSFRRVLTEALPEAKLVSFEVLEEGYVYVNDDKHSHGEYSIEAILRK